MSTRSVSFRQVQRYLETCETYILEGYCRALALSLGQNPSCPYALEQVKGVEDPNPHPLVKRWFEQNPDEKSWSKLMKVTEKVARKRGVGKSHYRIHKKHKK